MKAAEIAARRGHAVTLAEAGHRLGGRLGIIESASPAANLLASVAWIEQELSLLKVEVLTQTLVDEAFVRDFAPDAIILATGATTTNDLGVATDASVVVLSTDEAAAGFYEGVKFDMKDTRSLMIDLRANYETALVVDVLARRGSAVTVVTPHLHFGVNMGFTHLSDYLGLLPKWGVKVMAMSALDRVSQGRVHVRNVFSGEEHADFYDFIVAGVAPKPRNGLYEVLRKHAPVKMAGDAVAPRSALEAFREGDRAGRTI
jgi:hypothetical protein